MAGPGTLTSWLTRASGLADGRLGLGGITRYRVAALTGHGLPNADLACGASARRCLMAYGAIKMANLVRDHHVDPAALLGHKGTRSNVRPRPAWRQIPAAAA